MPAKKELETCMRQQFGDELSSYKTKSIYFDGASVGKRTVFVPLGETFFTRLLTVAEGRDDAAAVCQRARDEVVPPPLVGLCSAIAVDGSSRVASLFFLLCSRDGTVGSAWNVVGRWDLNRGVFSSDRALLVEAVRLCFPVRAPSPVAASPTSLSSPSPTAAAAAASPVYAASAFSPHTPGMGPLSGEQDLAAVDVADACFAELVGSDAPDVGRDHFLTRIADTVTLPMLGVPPNRRREVAAACAKAFCGSTGARKALRDMWRRFVACFALELQLPWPTLDWVGAQELCAQPWFFPRVDSDVKAENLLADSLPNEPRFLVRYAPDAALWNHGCFVYSRFSAPENSVLHTRVAFHRAGMPNIVRIGANDVPTQIPLEQSGLTGEDLCPARRFLYVVGSISGASGSQLCLETWPSLMALIEEVMHRNKCLKPSTGHAPYF